MSSGVKVSKTGFDVGTVDNEDLSYNSDYATLKVFMKGRETVTVPVGTPASIGTSITHSLGYIPHTIIRAQDNLLGTYTDIYEVPFTDVDPGYLASAGTGVLRLQAGVEANNTAYNVRFLYFILGEDVDG